MKNLLFLIVLLTSSLFAQVQWHKYENTLQTKNSKIIMLMLGRKSCPACAYMNDVVFSDKKIQKELNQNFLPVHIDVDTDFVPDGMTYIGTPTFYFVTQKEKVLFKTQGAFNIKDFLDILKKVKAKR